MNDSKAAPPAVEGKQRQIDRLATVQWTNIMDWPELSEEARRRLTDHFCGRYLIAIQAFFGHLSRERPLPPGAGVTADDITQAFVHDKVLRGVLFRNADREAGRFRDYLKQALRYYYIEQLRKARRNLLSAATSLDGDPELSTLEIPVSDRSDAAFDQECARALVLRALERTRDECTSRGLGVHFDLFVARFLDPAHADSTWAELGKHFEVGEDGDRVGEMADRARQHFKVAVTQLVREDVGARRFVPEEVKALLDALRRRNKR